MDGTFPFVGAELSFLEGRVVRNLSGLNGQRPVISHTRRSVACVIESWRAILRACAIAVRTLDIFVDDTVGVVVEEEEEKEEKEEKEEEEEEEEEDDGEGCIGGVSDEKEGRCGEEKDVGAAGGGDGDLEEHCTDFNDEEIVS